MNHRTFSGCLATAVVLAAASCAADLEPPDATGAATAPITNAPELHWSSNAHAVSIWMSDPGHICGAAVLSRHWLLTAAHCIDESPQGSNLHVDPSPMVRTYDGPADFYMHPDYGGAPPYLGSDTDDDIGLIHLRGDGLSILPTPAALHVGGDLAVGDAVRIIGYGYGTGPGGSSDCDDGAYGTRRVADYTLTTVDNEKLELDYGSRELCGGDSGSPWLVEVAGQWMVAGVTTNRRPYHDADACRVQQKVDWIESLTASAGRPLSCPVQRTDGTYFRQCFEEPDAARSVAAGRHHACAVLDDGRVRCWGRNHRGQLGDASFAQRERPVTVVLDGPARQVSAGREHSCAVLDDDTVRCWGSNGAGQLGSGAVGSNHAVPRTVLRPDGSALSDVLEVTAGMLHTCAVTRAGGAWCWGANSTGQLGVGDTTDRSRAQRVGWWRDLERTDRTRAGATRSLTTSITFEPYRIFEPLDDVAFVNAGQLHTCAVLGDGSAWCWGDNAFGQLGNGSTTDAWSPTAVTGLSVPVRDISGGRYHTCAVVGAFGGGARCWGANFWGQHGTGGTASTTVPVVTSPGLGWFMVVASGPFHTCFGNGTDDEQVCAGYDATGAHGTSAGSSETWQQSLVWGVRDVSVGDIFSCTLRFDGSVACYGDNTYGQLGDGTTTDRPEALSVQELNLPQ